MEFFHRATNFPFMSTRKVWYGLSAVLIVISIVSLFTRGLDLGVDFTGGVTVQASFPGAANRDAVSRALASAGYADPQVTIFGTSRDIAIRLPPTKDNTEAVRSKIEQILRGVDAGAEIRQVEVIGPQVGGELQRSAVQALLATLALIFGYIALRFHTWRLSLGAILAVLHDPILVLGTFSLTRTSFDLTVVAAMLAVIGYSLNDTVVVFDRIRERFHGSRRLQPVLVLDQSINQTLSRTIMTKVVTLIVVVALYALGGPVLRGFSEALIIGILAGTYSSIYISSAVALDCGLKAEHLLPSSVKRPVDSMP
ncbi:MAG TPA: protein translocase subunit SecF [Steroidobacteraceae bacterium]|nr:protein translocase subunit SecF [Steroidobacteraceae bacterium]